jgi:hypothetical protein
MSMLRIAKTNLDIIDVFSNPNEMRVETSSEQSRIAVAQFRETIRIAKGKLRKSDDFAYIRTRAIGSMEKWGPNGNGDGFPLSELQASYKTFIGKGNFIDHHSDDITKIRGLVVDAFMNNDDESVECLIAVDRKSHPQLARDIETGVVNSVSMGTRVGYSNCSVCKHAARTENEYCDHVRNYKGMKIGWLTNNEAHKNGAWPVHEVNHDLEFIELSWVSVPAFKEANVLERLASLRKAVVDNKDDALGSAIAEGMQENSILNNEIFNFAKSETEKEIIELARMGLKSRVYKDSDSVEALKSAVAAAECRDTECAFDPRKSNKTHVKETTAMQRIKIDTKELTIRKPSKDFSAKGAVTIENKSYDWRAVSADKKEWQVSFDSDVLDAFSSQGIGQIINAIKELLGKNIDSTELVVAGLNSSVKTGYLQNQNDDPNMSEYIDDRYKDSKESDKAIYPNKNLEVPGVGDVRDAEFKAYSGSAKEGPAGALGKTHMVTENSSKDEIAYKTELQRAYMKYKLVKQAAADMDDEDESASDGDSSKDFRFLLLDDHYGASPLDIVDNHSSITEREEVGEDGVSRYVEVTPEPVAHSKEERKQLAQLEGDIMDKLDAIYDLKKELLKTQYFQPGALSREKQEAKAWAKTEEVKEQALKSLDSVDDVRSMRTILKELNKYYEYIKASKEGPAGKSAPKGVADFSGYTRDEDEDEIEGIEVQEGEKAAKETAYKYQDTVDKILASVNLKDASALYELLPEDAISKMPEILHKKMTKKFDELRKIDSKVQRERSSVMTPELASEYEAKSAQRDALIKSLDSQLLAGGVSDAKTRRNKIQDILSGKVSAPKSQTKPKKDLSGTVGVDLDEIPDNAEDDSSGEVSED